MSSYKDKDQLRGKISAAGVPQKSTSQTSKHVFNHFKYIFYTFAFAQHWFKYLMNESNIEFWTILSKEQSL